MKIIATLKQPDQRSVAHAVGIGQNGSDALKAVLASCSRFVSKSQVSELGARIQDVIDDWPPYSIEADFDDPARRVHIL